jgi:hypothetical protein
MRGELADLELQRAEAEGQLQQLQEVRARLGLLCPQDCEAIGMGWGPSILSTLSQPWPRLPDPGSMDHLALTPTVQMEKLRPKELAGLQ